MKTEFEDARANATPDKLCEMAETLWDAGAHFFRCKGTAEPPFSDEDKAPKYGEKWKTKRTHISDIKVWIKEGNLIGIAHPARNIGLSAMDCDKPVDVLEAKFDEIGHRPLAVHISSGAKKKHGGVGYHAWYKTTEGTKNHWWEGGEVYSTSTHFIVVYNLPALYNAYVRAGDADAPDIDLGAFTTDVNPAKRSKASTDGIVATVAIEDEEIPEDNRHDTTISKIGRAVEQAKSKQELNSKLKPIIESYRLSFTEKDTMARVESMKAELPRLKTHANALWKKKTIRKRYQSKVATILRNVGNTESATAQIKEIIEAYQTAVKDEGLPTPDTCQAEIVDFADYIIRNLPKNIPEQVICEAPHGTIEGWQEAAGKLGFKFKFNTLNKSGYVLIPEKWMDAESGGGQWQQIDDNARSTIVAVLEKHAKGWTQDKEPKLKGVWLSKDKSRDAVTSLFSKNRYCPMRDYLESLPEWCGEDLITSSMDRGGMRIEAGPFTQAVQAYPWIFVVRNALFPGSSNREHVVLYGPHNSGKSKFVKLMLPEYMLEYFNEAFSLDGSLKVKLERSMGKVLMECGEFGQGGAKDWNAVKQWLTLSEVSGERLAYKEYAVRHRLTATTIFTTNHPELPPCDEASLSRFIWANVSTPATQVNGLVWTHFDDLYDADRPDLGTFREQYFAQAYHIVKEATEKVEYEMDGVTQTMYRCNPKWLPPNHLRELIDWNKRSGSTYTTEQEYLVQDTIRAIEMLNNCYEDDGIDNDDFYPTMEIVNAVYCVREGSDYTDWWDLVKAAKEDASSTEFKRKTEVEKSVNLVKLGNAMPLVGDYLRKKIKKKQLHWDTHAGKQIVRGFQMYPVYTED